VDPGPYLPDVRVRVSCQVDFKDARDCSLHSFFCSKISSDHLDVLGEHASVAVDEAGDKTSSGRALGQCSLRHVASGPWQSASKKISSSRILAASILVEEIMLLLVQ
jgi:hypothetical protein